MKKITLALTLIIIANLAFANPVDTLTAKRVAVNFWKQNNTGPTVGDTTSRTGEKNPNFIVGQTGMPFHNFYILTKTDSIGFVIVSADDRVIPILGYSLEDTFNTSNMPPNLQEWLMGYEQQIQYTIDENIEPLEDIVTEWNSLLEGGTLSPKSTTEVEPLLKTHWDQSPYYNELCPTYLFGLGHTLTGCVATAMAQVMKYWNYPEHGSGYHSYNCDYYGTQSANFASTTYDWSHMPNQLTANSSNTQVNAVATLMYHCGVSVEMDYGWQSSAIQDISLVVNALKNYFKYEATTHLVDRSNYSTDAAWINLLKNELNNDRPIFYVGTGSNGGHAFVCDGYNNNNLFHFNWGWGGDDNGYYSINDLTPGSHDYTYHQKAVIGIQPSTDTEPELEMYSSLDVNDAWFGSNITGTIQILNTGSSFTGYMAVVIFNEEEIAVNSQIFSVNNLPYDYYSTGNININGGVPLIPGTYYAFALYSVDGNNWDLVPNGTNAYPYTTFDITYSAQMETNSMFSYTTFVQGQFTTINVDVWNSGSQTFYGKVSVKLANIEDGSVVQTIQELDISDGLPSNYHYTNGLDFTGTITATPRTYLMVLAYQREGQTQWYYAGSSEFPNPVFVTVVAAPSLSVSPSSISFQQSGGSNAINITSNVIWTANSSASWLTISPNNGTESSIMVVSATANNSSSSRSAIITIVGNNGVSPQTITVSQSGGIQPDQYEPNNTSAAAYNLGTVNSNSQNYNINANFHVTTDNDYYKINLPAGYSYTVNADLLDSYNDNNYTADAHFATSTDGNDWSSNHGSSMPELTLPDGGTVYFRVLPYTNYEIGTYKLQISVARLDGIEPDMYEPNNTVNTSYLLATISEQSSSVVADATFHTSSDVDHYKIDFPADYTYYVDAVIFDCANDPSCSVDAKISVSDDGVNWSSVYGNYIPTMTVEHGGRLCYRVLPQQDGATGTYRLHISVSRETGIQEKETPAVSLYPNPVANCFHLIVPIDCQIQRMEIYSMTGRLVQTIDCDQDLGINVSQLARGTYLIKVYTSEGLLMRKFVKS